MICLLIYLRSELQAYYKCHKSEPGDSGFIVIDNCLKYTRQHSVQL